VDDFKRVGVGLVWFSGDPSRARQAFIDRGGIDVAFFDQQVAAIDSAGLPAGLGAEVVNGLNERGEYLASELIFRQLVAGLA
jgi:hypothetical protein